MDLQLPGEAEDLRVKGRSPSRAGRQRGTASTVVAASAFTPALGHTQDRAPSQRRGGTP